MCHGPVVLELAREGLEEEVGDAGLDHALGRRAVGARLPVARQVGALLADHDAAAGLVDVGGLAHQARVRGHLGLAAAGHDHHLHVRPVAGLERPSLPHRELTVRVAKERPVLPSRVPSRSV